MWQGVEYTAAPGGMEEAIKNYCKKDCLLYTSDAADD